MPESPEAIAWELFKQVANSEGKFVLGAGISKSATPDRKWILDTYAECLEAVRNPSGRSPPVRK